MNDARNLHRKAMELASRALIAQSEGIPDEAQELYEQAYQLEAQAADTIDHTTKHEPTRSVLYRSAAALALECAAFEQVEMLVSKGLAGEPPNDIAQELRDILKKVVLHQSESEVASQFEYV